MNKIILLLSILIFASCKEHVADAIPAQEIAAVSESTDEALGGWLKIGVTDKLVASKLGAEHTVSNGEYSQVDGYYYEEWHYPELGIRLLMQSEEPNGGKKVSEITVTKPSGLRTSEGIRIGSYKDEVFKAYPDANQTDVTSNIIVVGNIYNGLFFKINKDKVSEIFIGALAE